MQSLFYLCAAYPVVRCGMAVSTASHLRAGLIPAVRFRFFTGYIAYICAEKLRLFMNTKLKGYVLGAVAAASYGMNPLFALPLYKEGMRCV